ncbi:ATP-NAD/AcoX kinase [Oleidesulfovibrio alaskensis G20]|jgi:NAD+ kinase|uniref:NAD kinase n=1 Tax=Oleidesulfovibrio alaskensis (strain ATCC BAA-1058 / DSM 17464 / G20) TaxID=207559 RepID=NADK_OLEA2|nr:NAD(+)/NADH kinase [Oleidesulfovibrio alaskensis]Q30Y32.1 RecName: Full=NAD kinase; AltName: Full=ATP-dependent NAD kinase [Oleidesulfovibrio alaskensis G20]ABB39414.1 ATP-NAD/AcoX kinase [Oleidesulfovibrio alaskensis G20]MBG0772507.1 NAD(+)/NADH kinase [Oleidesulfovibrio alaskensis]MBL3582131.1 NAD(+)/NADH kinase [Oleidesulfovibrio alaskensis]
MHRELKRVFIVTKQAHAGAAALAADMQAWFAARGIEAATEENDTASALPDFARSASCIMVLGGDGTMLSVSRRAVGLDVPLLGVNLGKVGFLAEVSAAGWQQAFTRLAENGLTCSERLALHFAVSREGRCVFEGTAVNDVVLHRGVLARVINLGLGVDGEWLGDLRADGLIVSTPTGATGYAVSAGGPLVHPDMSVYAITPICPFLNNFHPMVLAGSMRFEIRILEGPQEVYVTQDGQECFALQAGDLVTVTQASRGLLFVAVEGSTYFTRLRAKGFVRDPRGRGRAVPASS